MRKAFQYRPYPTKRQQRLLSEQLEELRWLWNMLLAERKQAWEDRREIISYYDQQNALPALKERVRPGLKQCILRWRPQQVAKRLDLAFEAFFRRVRVGEYARLPALPG